MATTSLWHISGKLKNLIDYVENPDKTTAETKGMSEYCKNDAPIVFKDLIENIDARYLVVTYNNTYNSRSTSSRNKITLEEIKEILDAKGSTVVKEKDHPFFNAGKTDLKDHKEFVFITKVGATDDN